MGRLEATLHQIVDGTIVADIGAGGGAWTFRLAGRITTEMGASGFERVRLIDRREDRPDLYALLFRKTS